jgi:hypothetical protein
MQNTIKLSVIITARNDNYGGNLINRINSFIKVLSHFTQKYRLKSELIIVEYNPIANKKRLYNELTVHPENEFLRYRFIEVPESFHKKCPGGDTMPMLEFLAKNIGIRRAHGEYILAMNPDIILSEGLIEWISKTELDKNTYYRANRHDITDSYFNSNLSVQEILNNAQSHVFMVFLNNKTQYHSWTAWIKRVFTSRSKKSLMMCPMFNNKDDGFDEKIIHERAAGDFLLMHSSLWEKVGAYDTDPISGFIDGYILYVLHCINAKQVILPYPIYHINHKVGRAGRPEIAVALYQEVIRKMLTSKTPYKQLDKEWGFPKEKFNEDIVAPLHATKAYSK